MNTSVLFFSALLASGCAKSFEEGCPSAEIDFDAIKSAKKSVAQLEAEAAGQDQRLECILHQGASRPPFPALLNEYEITEAFPDEMKSFNASVFRVQYARALTEERLRCEFGRRRHAPGSGYIDQHGSFRAIEQLCSKN